MTRASRILATLSASAVSLVASAQIVTDRPTESAGPSVVAPLLFQLEAGYRVSRHDEGTDGDTSHELPDALLRFGFAPSLEARVSWTGWTFRSNASGANDVSLGAKLALVPERGGRPAVSILGDVSLPVGEDGFSDDSTSTKLLGLFGMPLGDRWGLTWNVGPRFIGATGGGDGGVDTHWLYTAAVTRSVTTTLTVFAELFGELTLAREGSDGHRFQAGLTALAGERAQWDVRVGIGLSEGVSAWTFGAGLSARVPQ